MDPIREAMLKKSRSAKLEQRGKLISLLCISLIVIVVVAIFFFVASKGLATFFQNKINLWSFLRRVFGIRQSKMRTAIPKLAPCQ